VLEIINGRRSISGDTALRLGRYFGTTAQLWMNLQASYDLEAQREGHRTGGEAT
jgi:addiction module HigA family antidote